MSLLWWHYLFMVGIGAGGGFLCGVFGIGGGILAVPAMVLLLNFGQHQAQGTSLAMIVVTAAVGATHYGRNRDVDWGAALALVAGSVLWVVIGASLAQRTDAVWLRLAFAVFIGGIAAAMVPRADPRLFSPVLGAFLLVMGARLLLR